MADYLPHMQNRLREAFDKANERELMARVKPQDLERIRKIGEQTITRLNRADELFRKLYPERVNRELKRLIDERASLARDFRPHGIPTDAFNLQALRVAAERMARQRQRNLLARIRSSAEIRKAEIAGVPERVRADGGRRQVARAFDRVRDR